MIVLIIINSYNNIRQEDGKTNRGVRGSYINKTMICPDDGDNDTAQHEANDSEQMPTRWRSADYDQMTLSSSRWSRKMPSRTPAKTACVAFVSCAKILCEPGTRKDTANRNAQWQKSHDRRTSAAAETIVSMNMSLSHFTSKRHNLHDKLGTCP
jgi:hypothetical protein